MEDNKAVRAAYISDCSLDVLIEIHHRSKLQ